MVLSLKIVEVMPKEIYLMAMKIALLILTACSFFLMTTETHAQTPRNFSAVWEKQHISNLLPSTARHKDLQKYLKGLESIGLKVEEVGKSYGNREIYQIELFCLSFLLINRFLFCAYTIIITI